MKLTGAQIILECLKEHDVDTVFGFPGGTILPVYDAIYGNTEVRHILTCHEQHAAHAADGYARATGKTGVVMATSGPGATNLVTGIATAYMDSVPLVAITANVIKRNLGKDSFQEVDITGITSPITKHNMIVQTADELADAVREAFFIAGSGRPGPVLVDIPKDLTETEAEYRRRAPVPLDRCNAFWPSDLEAAANMIGQSKRPFILVGGGVIVAGAEAEVAELAHRIKAPITCTLMGIGGYPETGPNWTGTVGMHGSKASAECLTHCDLLIAIGTRFSERVTSDRSKFCKQAKVLHIDVDPAEINKNVHADCEVIGNAKDVLVQLLPRVAEKTDDTWLSQAQKWKKIVPIPRDPETPFFPKEILEAVQHHAPKDAVFTTEVGQHQMWAAQYLTIDRPRQFISSGGLGTMGFGLGAAIGASLGTGKRTINVAGDGSFQMNLQELATAVRYNLPVTVLLFDNHVLGMVRQWQTLFYGKRYSETTIETKTDYVALARAMGAAGYHIAGREDLEPVLEKAFLESGPVVIACDIHEDEMVLPMIPGGAPMSEIILDLDGRL